MRVKVEATEKGPVPSETVVTIATTAGTEDVIVHASQVTEDGVCLAPPPEARQVKMHADDPKHRSVQLDVGEYGAPRFERGEVEQVAL